MFDPALESLWEHYEERYDEDARLRSGIGTPQLTAREWEVLQLAGEGLPPSRLERLARPEASARAGDVTQPACR